MPHEVSEADWKVFRQLRELALERYCGRVLKEIDLIRHDPARSLHERYLSVFGLLQQRDDELERAFTAPRRSQMLFQLAVIRSLGLLDPEELLRFTPEVRRSVEALADVVRRDA